MAHTADYAGPSGVPLSVPFIPRRVMLIRYYFDLEYGAEVIRDEIGAEALDLAEAVAAAREIVSEMASDVADWTDANWTLVIRDGAGQQVARLPVKH